MEKILPLKRFGQNYLTDNNIINKIINEINPSKDELIVEIGPGTGALTSKLIESTAEILPWKLIKELKKNLSDQFPNCKISERRFS